MDPNYAGAMGNLAALYADLHQYDLWLQNWNKSATLMNDHENMKIAEEAAKVYAKSGYPAAMRRIIELQLELAKRRYVDPADIGGNYAEVGEKNQAFPWFEKAYAEKSNRIAWIKVDHRADSLRSDPRYAALLKKMGLPQ